MLLHCSINSVAVSIKASSKNNMLHSESFNEYRFSLTDQRMFNGTITLPAHGIVFKHSKYLSEFNAKMAI